MAKSAGDVYDHRSDGPYGARSSSRESGRRSSRALAERKPRGQTSFSSSTSSSTSSAARARSAAFSLKRVASVSRSLSPTSIWGWRNDHSPTVAPRLRSSASADRHLWGELEPRERIGRRDASLRDIARSDSFALAAENDEDAVYRWLRRVPPAQRAFHEAVMDRGAEMNEATHTLWTQIHNDGVLELENALRGLQGDLHAQGGTRRRQRTSPTRSRRTSRRVEWSSPPRFSVSSTESTGSRSSSSTER